MKQEKTGGKIIVIDGTDGSGKATQVKRLIRRLEEASYSTATFDFPQYGRPSAYFVEKYLNKGYGGALQDIGPYRAAIFYALDRFDVSSKIIKARDSGKLVVMNRYVAANMGHQGAKIELPKERKKFFRWLDWLEFEVLGIPRPDLNIILHVPAEVAQGLVDRKSQRDYLKGGKRRDLHEADIEHLKRAERVYLEMTHLFPGQFRLIECMDGDRLMLPKEIEELIANEVARVLVGTEL